MLKLTGSTMTGEESSERACVDRSRTAHPHAQSQSLYTRDLAAVAKLPTRRLGFIHGGIKRKPALAPYKAYQPRASSHSFRRGSGRRSHRRSRKRAASTRTRTTRGAEEEKKKEEYLALRRRRGKTGNREKSLARWR
eukprot:407554-Rhodomonas_salina.1